VIVDSNGAAVFTDPDNNAVFRTGSDGTLQIVAGNGIRGFSGDGGPAISASLADPAALAVDLSGNIYIADYGNNRIRKVTPDGQIVTVSGSGVAGFSGDGGLAIEAARRRRR
jgi:hypothetical protein